MSSSKKAARPDIDGLTAGPFASQLDREIAEAGDYRKRQAARVAGTYKLPALPKLKKEKRRRPRRHLVIGDSHAHPDDPNHRFEWLGRMIQDRSPDVVVNMGDMVDYPSLFGYDQGAKGPLFQGMKYWRDTDAGVDAMERINAHLSGKRPRMVYITGNHEHRVNRMLEAEPRFMGVVGIEDLQREALGWEVFPFLEAAYIDGVNYSHYFKAPGSKQPVGGVMPARAVVMKFPGSFNRVFGHTHRFGYYEQGDGSPSNNGKIVSINAGCYFDTKHDGVAHRWAGRDVDNWRGGILELEVEDEQISDFHWTSLETIRQRYS